MHCNPACRVCLVAGSCVREQLPAISLPKRRPPRRAAVQATYPHNDRPGYKLLTCGHYTDRAQILFYSVWAPKDKHKQYCDKCHGWRKELNPKVNDSPSDTTNSSETLF